MDTCDGDHGAVVAHGLVRMGSEYSVLLEHREQALDGVPGLVKMDIEGGWFFPAGLGCNDCLCSNRSDLVTAGCPKYIGVVNRIFGLYDYN